MASKPDFQITGSSNFRCSPWTRAQGVDPIGTAGRHDLFLLVEVPLPWPSDITQMPALPFTPRDDRIRLQAVVPTDQRASGRVGFTAWRRVGTHSFQGRDYEVPQADLRDALETLIVDPRSGDVPSIGPAPQEILLCTHGKRDTCCGRLGTVLHGEVAERWLGVRVRRTSHTGGHRFAPTGLSFPEGRAWAFMDVPILDQLVHRDGAVDALHIHQRGTTALDPFEQAFERVIFESVGWSWLECEVVDVRTSTEDDGAADVALEWKAPDGTSRRARGRVEVSRQIPVLACGNPPDAAQKVSSELSVRNIEWSEVRADHPGSKQPAGDGPS